MSPSAAPSSAASHRVPTACPMDCPDSCSLDAEVRDGRVVALHATPAHALTAGDGAPFFCSKMSRYPERSRGPDRLGVPLRRVGRKGEARFEPVGWDAALDLVAARLDAVRRVRGGDAILPYHYDGSNGVFAHDAVDGALWRSLGAVETLRTLCAAPATGAATEMYGKFPGVAFQDYVEARTVVLWGCNPSVSNTHLAPHLLAARRAGAAFVAVDPRRTPFAATADLHLRLRPGSDLAVALWLIAETERRGRLAADFLRTHAKNHESLLARARPWTAERAAAAADVDVRDLARFADLYLDRAPAVIRVGWGMERNRNGDGAMAAVLALPAIAGKFGVRGGGYTLSNSGAVRFDGEAMIGVPKRPDARTVNMVQLGRALAPEATPRVDALFVYDANPIVSTPDSEAVRRGLMRDDLFTVVHEQVMTDTAHYADVVLPATTFLEECELHRSYGFPTVQRILPAQPPFGEARPNAWVFAELARRLGLSGPAFDARPDDLAARYLKACRGLPDDAAQRLAAEGRVSAVDARPIQFGDAFPYTADGKADLDPEAWRARGVDAFAFAPDPATPEFPLALLSPASPRTINSTLGDLDRTPLWCALAPTDAVARGIAPGDRIRVFNARSELTALARIDDALRPGVCVIPKGVWLRNTREGRGPNALIPADVTPATGGATYNDARVQVARAV